jgi:hypothetical protein
MHDRPRAVPTHPGHIDGRWIAVLGHVHFPFPADCSAARLGTPPQQIGRVRMMCGRQHRTCVAAPLPLGHALRLATGQHEKTERRPRIRRPRRGRQRGMRRWEQTACAPVMGRYLSPSSVAAPAIGKLQARHGTGSRQHPCHYLLSMAGAGPRRGATCAASRTETNQRQAPAKQSGAAHCNACRNGRQPQSNRSPVATGTITTAPRSMVVDRAAPTRLTRRDAYHAGCAGPPAQVPCRAIQRGSQRGGA